MGWTDSELALTALAAMLSPTTLFLSVLALVVGERPMRTGLWFYLGALTATLAIGVVAALVLGNAAATPNPSTPKTWVAVIDVVAGVFLLVFVVRFLKRPRDPKRVQSMIAQMNKVASSPVVAIIAAGATLANPGAFIPLALKDISETNPNAAQYVAEWVAFSLISLLPLSVALVALGVAPEWAKRVLNGVRVWLERNARTVAAVLLLALAAVMMRNGIAGLTH
jgi:hypothetical protein